METERSLREKLAASHHIIHFNGYDDLISTHLSARIPNTDTLLITPHNIPFEEVCASNLVLINLEGEILSKSEFEVMPQASNIHIPIYKKKDTILCAMHTHSIYGSAVSALSCGLLPINQHVMRFYDDIAYCDLNGLALENEGENIASYLGDKKVMILRNHGLLATGESIETAMYLLYYLERCCKIQIKTLSTGEKINEIQKEICQKIKDQFEEHMSPKSGFSALVKRIEGKSSVNYKA